MTRCAPAVGCCSVGNISRTAAFIGMEIYRDNRISDPPQLMPQVKAFGLPSEPWVFVIDRRGRIADRLEGAFSVSELERAVQKGIGTSS